MTIRNMEKFVERLWDWGFLDACFTRNVRVTDVDGLVECNGKFLIIEAKGPGQNLTGGQFTALKALARDERWTVLVIRGLTNQPLEMGQISRDGRLRFEPCDEQYVCNFVAAWWQYANQRAAAS